MQTKLWEIRKSYKMNQSEVADILGISVQAYRLKEQGKKQFTQDEMFSLSNYFKRDIEDIFLPRKNSTKTVTKTDRKGTIE